MKLSATGVVVGAALLVLSPVAVYHGLSGILGWVWEQPRCVRDWFDYMCTEAVCRKWGERPLDTEKFRAAGANRAEWDERAGWTERAEMACSLLKNKDEYLGKELTWIVDVFGEHYGYYFYDSVPAYLISVPDHPGDVWDARDAAWQIVFTHRGGIVDDVFVHRNCC